jgi:hypothetical protein
MTDNLILGAQADENGDLYFKSQSYASSSSAQIANATQLDIVEIPFANSLASIKSIYRFILRELIELNSTLLMIQLNSNGSVQFTIAGQTIILLKLLRLSISARPAVVLRTSCKLFMDLKHLLILLDVAYLILTFRDSNVAGRFN